jgi:hypothetical protein
MIFQSMHSAYGTNYDDRSYKFASVKLFDVIILEKMMFTSFHA